MPEHGGGRMTPPTRESAAVVDGLDERERHLLRACIDSYAHQIHKACEQDQGDPDGKPETLGHEVLIRLDVLRGRLA